MAHVKVVVVVVNVVWLPTCTVVVDTGCAWWRLSVARCFSRRNGRCPVRTIVATVVVVVVVVPVVVVVVVGCFQWLCASIVVSCSCCCGW